MGDFLRKHSHVFEVFTHPVKKNVRCRVTERMLSLIQEEKAVIKESKLENVRRLRKLLMMSKNGTLHAHALRLVSREFGLPEDFRESILSKYLDDFKLVHLEVVALVERDEDLAVAEVEKWREREYNERWLSEFETKYAFPINFPTGFVIEKGFRVEKMTDVERFAHFRKDLRTEELKYERASGGYRTDIVANKSMDATRDGGWILPLLEGSDD
ncbi:hypothetical protein Cgig2_017025 [Carnegiea gigantea]|uniref:PORR domain-containing protein n=1 Tax=Carnegiea gigantea TaxID=171969 RepID=A0A9Q1KHX8_9CARY|nr:hypothetical protein Cgig2_017025 [Carnegiea gigantea]